MDAETIISQIKTILLANETLLTYVKTTFLGDRDANTIFPNITVEPDGNPTEQELAGGVREMNLKVVIGAAILISDKEKAIVGDATNKGVMDIEKDVKAALRVYWPDLNSTCFYFELTTQQYRPIATGNGRVVFLDGNFYYRES